MLDHRLGELANTVTQSVSQDTSLFRMPTIGVYRAPPARRGAISKDAAAAGPVAGGPVHAARR